MYIIQLSKQNSQGFEYCSASAMVDDMIRCDA